MSKANQKDVLATWMSNVDRHALSQNNDPMPEDIVGAARWVGQKVEDFLRNAGLVNIRRDEEKDLTICAANENFQVSAMNEVVGMDGVFSLIESVGVAAPYRTSCAKRIGAIMRAQLGQGSNEGVWSNYNKAGSADSNRSTIPLEQIYPSAILGDIRNTAQDVTAAQEAFGISMDKIQPDMKLSMTVTLMQYITSFTPRVVPIVSTSQPDVTIEREVNSVLDMSDPKSRHVRMIELYRKPAMVSSVLKRIHPLTENDADGVYLVDDDIIKFGVSAHLQELALIEGKPGWDRFNHTDIVADQVEFDEVILQLSKAAGTDPGTEPAVNEQFRIRIPRSRARFVRNSNSKSSDRFAHTEYSVVLDKNTKMIPAASGGSETSTILAGLASENDGIAVDIIISGHINLETSVIDAQPQITLRGITRVAGAEVATTTTELVKALEGSELVGYTVDAQYSEENLRKTTLRSSLDRSSLNYTLPTGRAIVIDWAYGQDAASNAAARLAQIEHIGRDIKNLEIIDRVSDHVNDELKMIDNNPGAFENTLGAQYAAGDLVNPFVFVDTIDFSKVLAVRSADSSGDIKQYVRTKLNAVTSLMLSRSLYNTQLANGAKPVFRCLTSEYVKGNALMCRQIHAHLDVVPTAGSGVEYVMDLDNGVRLEIVTTTFESMDNRMLIMPFVANSNSVLNWGLNYDQGTMIGNYTSSHDGLHQRVFATTREMLIPTDVLIAKLDVVGLDTVTNLYSN